MKGWKGWLLLTGVFFLFFLAWRLPAELCWRWWAGSSGGAAARLQAGNLEGSWSRGRLASLQSGSLLLTDLAWTFRPLGLLAGRLEFALGAELPGAAPLNATLIIRPGSQELRDLRGRIPAASLGEALLPGLGLAGHLESRGLGLTIRQGRPVAAGGSLSWLQPGTAFPEPVNLGDLELQLATRGEVIAATLKDRGGPLQINVLTSLKPDGNYELSGELLPRGQLTPGQASLVRLFGAPAADGRIRLQRVGRLAPIY